MTISVSRVRDLPEHEGQLAADAIEAATESVTDAIHDCEVALYNCGLTEEASFRIAKRVATQVGSNYTGNE